MVHSRISRTGALGVAMIAAIAALPTVEGARAGFERPSISAAMRSPGADVLLAAAVRVIRRSTIYVATLPKGCVRTQISNTVVWRCGKTYYEADGNRYVVVYID